MRMEREREAKADSERPGKSFDYMYAVSVVVAVVFPPNQLRAAPLSRYMGKKGQGGPCVENGIGFYVACVRELCGRHRGTFLPGSGLSA